MKKAAALPIMLEVIRKVTRAQQARAVKVRASCWSRRWRR